MAGTADDSWMRAVDGNFGGTPNFVGDQAFSSDYLVLGDYGVDTADNLVWAVVNHNSQFAAVPEPSTFVLLGMAAVSLLIYTRRRGSCAVETSRRERWCFQDRTGPVGPNVWECSSVERPQPLSFCQREHQCPSTDFLF